MSQHNHRHCQLQRYPKFCYGRHHVINKRRTTSPLKVTLANGRQVVSTHMCDINIAGFPFVLTGHIIPDLSIALLFGIQVLTEVGCNLNFDNHKCTVRYNGTIILSGDKDQSTDLWTIPLGSTDMTAHCVHDVIPLVAPVMPMPISPHRLRASHTL